MLDKELAEYCKKWELAEEEKGALQRSRLVGIVMAIAILAGIVLIIIAAGTVFSQVFAADIVPSWAPPATTSADWLAILYILGLVILGGAIGISKFLAERNG
jgi:hypothetical protein